MITIDELKTKAVKLFFRICTLYLKGESSFPYPITFNKKTEGAAYSDWKTQIIPLMQASKQEKGKGFSIEWKLKRVAGVAQQVPTRIYFESMEDYLFFTSKKKELELIETSFKKLTNEIPVLGDWAVMHPETLLQYSSVWDDIVKVLLFIFNNEKLDGYYLRELPIEVHSKFIEQNAAILRTLLDQSLPQNRINANETDFSGRYGLKRAGVYTQIRILDDALRPYLGYDDCALLLEDAAWLKWTPAKVFIIENQACFLSFPQVKDAVAIFGQGFKSRLSMHLNWLQGSELYCWFDLDTAGFEMLNMIRMHYPNAASLMMDEITFEKFRAFSVTTAGRKRSLPLLNEKETKVYSYLSDQNLRLEQERISQGYVIETMQAII